MPDIKPDEPGVSRLAQDLEDSTLKSLEWIKNILDEPIDVENGDLLRAQAHAVGTAVNAQLRADAMSMQKVRKDKTLELLVKLIAAKSGEVPNGDSFDKQTVL